MAVKLSPLAGAGWQFFDNNGIPLAGGLLYVYQAGTTTPATTYTSISGLTANSNPIILDAAGRLANEVWLTETNSYKFILKDATNVQIGSWDNIQGINDIASFTNDLANTSDPTKGDALVGFRQSNAAGLYSGTVGRTVHQKLQESVSVLDFGADPTGVTDSTTAFNSAIATGRKVIVPSGTYLVADVTVNSNLDIEGEGTNTTSLVVKTNNSGAFLRASNEVYNIRIASMTIKANTGVTGARAYKQVDKSNYTAYCEFIDLNTWADLAIAYDGFFIFTTWTNCIDGYNGTAPGAQTHQAINSNPAAYGQAKQTNLNQVINCEFFRGTDPTGFVSISYGFNWLFQATDFEIGTVSAIIADGIFGISITNCWFEANTASYIISINVSPAPNPQGTKNVLIYNSFIDCQATNTNFINSTSGELTIGINGLALANVPVGFNLTNITRLTQLTAIQVLSGSTAVFGSIYQDISRANIDTSTIASTENYSSVINSPYTQNANILPIGPSGLGASNFTNAGFTTIANAASAIGLTGQAVRFTLSSTANAAYYSLPAKTVAFLIGKTITLAMTGYTSAGVSSEFFEAAIWANVTPTNANTTVRGTDIVTPSSENLQTSYVTYTVPAGATSLAIGVFAGGNASGATVSIETMNVQLGEIKTSFAGV